VDNPYLVPFLIRISIFEGNVVWCAPRTDNTTTCLKEIGLCVQNNITILSSIVIIIWWWWVGGYLYDHFNEHKNLHYDNEDIHMSSTNHKETFEGLDLDLLTILY
jgi:hypothetical protein